MRGCWTFPLTSELFESQLHLCYKTSALISSRFILTAKWYLNWQTFLQTFQVLHLQEYSLHHSFELHFCNDCNNKLLLKLSFFSCANRAPAPSDHCKYYTIFRLKCYQSNNWNYRPNPERSVITCWRTIRGTTAWKWKYQ